jgi:transglutaminase-like putative cysteine protease
MMTQVLRDPAAFFFQRLRRLTVSVRTLFSSGDLTALLLVSVVLLMPVLALEAADWPLGLGIVLPVLFLSAVFGLLLARSQYNELFALIASGVYGGAFVLFFASLSEPGGLLAGINSVFQRIIRWLLDALTGGINQDELVFTMLVAMLFWFLGYSAAWHVFRIDRVWRALLPPGLILVTNSIYYGGDRNLDGYLIVFLFAALLLVVRSNLDAREWDWYVNSVRVPRRVRQQFYRLGAIFALLTLLGAWIIPSADVQERLDQFQEFLAEEPLTQFSEFWNRLFAAGDIQGPTTADYYGSDSLQLGGAIQLGNQTVLLVTAPPGRRYYWRSRVFDTYEGGRWLPAADTRLTDPQSPLSVLHEPYVAGARTPVSQTFTIGERASRLVYTAPQTLSVDMPTRTDLRYIGSDDRFVNPERGSGDVKAMNISVIRPVRVLRPGESYAATSLISTASASQLRAAPAVYPQWVRDLYLYVSPSVSGRTIDLARLIVQEAGAVTPYDQAKAIETWLRQNITYNETIPQPPRNQDPVDWLLFDLREGYCNYYASAMIVMLRALGVPARMAAGFAQGTWNADLGQYEVKERDAHTWVEVYFPGYGWVEFEPTAAQAPLSRVDDTPSVQQPSPTPPASPTPTATPTASDTPTPAPTTPPAAAEAGRELPTLTPTLTPTQTPTVTPVIIPTIPPADPTDPNSRDVLSFLLSLLGVVLLAALTILLLALLLVFIWWWWEWRGMGGLSPVTRAYARLERYLPLVGLRFGQNQTPSERRSRVAQELPAVEPPVTAITDLYTVERYGPNRRHPLEVERMADTADTAWSAARGGILRRWLRRLLTPWRR